VVVRVATADDQQHGVALAAIDEVMPVAFAGKPLLSEDGAALTRASEACYAHRASRHAGARIV
jgi:hypothetical protein